MSTLESKTASTIMQKQIEVIACGKKYQVARPTISTLAFASEVISELPAIKLDSDNIVSECLSIAKYCKKIGEIIAILILGSNRLIEIRTYFFGFIKISVNMKDVLAKEIVDNLTPKEINELIVKILSEMELSFFFATITSLFEINILRKTKGLD